MTELDAIRARYRTDCRLFKGEKPCGIQESCIPCDAYDPMGFRILVVKLAAIGDVLRTTPILPALRERYGRIHVTWLTDPGAAQLLQGAPGIDRLLSFGAEASAELLGQEFDLCLCLDKEPRATGLARRVVAREHRGFAMSPQGTLTIANPEAEYAYRLGLQDSLKFKENRRSYPEIVLEAIGLPSSPLPPYQVPLPAGTVDAARERLRALGARRERPLVGLNTGCGPVFATKKWTEDGYAELARLLVGDPELGGVQVALLGGPDELERNARLQERLAGLGITAIPTGCDNGLRDFAALVACLDLLVTGDTLALHLGIAARVPTVVVMGSTSWTEIELYGRGAKVVTDFPCAPCYLKRCPYEVTCMEAMPATTVFAAARQQLLAHRAGTEAALRG